MMGAAVLNRDDMLFEQMLACLRGDMDLIKFGIARESENLADPVAPASHHHLMVKAADNYRGS